MFGDGSTFECDVIVACTGYKNTFPFAEETHPDINEYGQNPRLLYKQIFHPNYGSEVAYFGFARPAFGSIPPTSEMQSRFYSMVVNGDLNLPCKTKMEKVALEDKVRVFFLVSCGGLPSVCLSTLSLWWLAPAKELQLISVLKYQEISSVKLTLTRSVR